MVHSYFSTNFDINPFYGFREMHFTKDGRTDAITLSSADTVKVRPNQNATESVDIPL